MTTWDQWGLNKTVHCHGLEAQVGLKSLETLVVAEAEEVEDTLEEGKLKTLNDWMVLDV